MADEAAAVAIVTGGAQGLGAAICVCLLKHGYKVCLADIQDFKGKHVSKQLQDDYGTGKVLFSCCDVTKEEDYKRTFEDTLKEFHRVDVLINNAGIVLEQDPETLMKVNLLGPIIGCQTALKYMGKSNGGNGGMVINTSSILGFVPFSAMPTYVATKHGIIGLTRSYGLPYHFGRDGITFCALCPSLIDTALLESCQANSLAPGTDFRKGMALLRPDDVARGVLKLLQDRINGSTLVISFSRDMEYVGLQEAFEDIKLL